jgi:selenocysteine-specific elongation factor
MLQVLGGFCLCGTFHLKPINMVSSVLNLNVGILGHVDSGKTSLAKALSTTASTASFDKNPVSQERGITIDLGFSSLLVDMPQHLKNICSEEKLQLTLVDCPGHASLIRTIIGGIGHAPVAIQLPQQIRC